MKMLMVCLGNFCRSPLAEGILKDKAKKAGLDWEVDSAGTNCYRPGSPPHPYSQKVANYYGINISNKKGRDFTKNDIDKFDKIYVMDDENYYDVQQISGNNWNEKKVDYLLNELYPGENKSVPDPMSGSEEGFYAVYEILDRACNKIIDAATIKRKAQASKG